MTQMTLISCKFVDVKPLNKQKKLRKLKQKMDHSIYNSKETVARPKTSMKPKSKTLDVKDKFQEDLYHNNMQVFVRLEGFFCSICDFKTTQKSDYDLHKKTQHKTSNNDIADKPIERIQPTLEEHHLQEKVPCREELFDKTLSYRYFCCYCGLEQFETERLLKHISVVHLKW